MIELWVIFIVWGIVCYRIGFNSGSIKGAEIGVNITMIIVSKVVSIGEFLEIARLAKETLNDMKVKTKTGE